MRGDTTGSARPRGNGPFGGFPQDLALSSSAWYSSGFYRRLVRDYEHRPASSRSRVLWAMTSVMSRRLTGRTIASWRTA